MFGLAVALISNLSRSPVWRSVVLLLTSIVFLALQAQTLLAIVPLTAFLLLGYLGILSLERSWARSSAWSVAAVLLAYVWLKKYTFLPERIFLQSPYFTIGLSYIFFRVLHLLIDTGDQQERRHIGIAAYLTYTLNFTTLVSGPIQRYEEFANDAFSTDPIQLGPRVIGLQIGRIIRGFFKVNVLAMLLLAIQQDAFSQMMQASPLQPKLSAAFRLSAVYPFFLYANFSGYIDIVMGLARLMRVRLSENFDRPFSARSFLDFWSRWHITLSTWLKTYVYNPLLILLMRRLPSPGLQPSLGVFCFFVTFFLIGIWHGRTSEFVLFGFLQGFGVAANKLWQLSLTSWLGRKQYKALTGNPLYAALSRGLTFSWFAFTLFWFWESWAQIHRIATAITSAQWITVWLAIWTCATVGLALWETVRSALLSLRTSEGPVLTSRYALVVYASAMGLAALIVSFLLNQPAPEIIYKAF
jgi:D-alanyl-lipoteichoic acid acyltransferase DltB (MBOAT superfamily)